MADPPKGRGRGLALLQTLRKAQAESATPSQVPSPETTPGPSAAPSVVSSTAAGPMPSIGRGRMAAMMLAKMGQRNEGQAATGPLFSPASDISPTMPSPTPAPPRGAGRGIKLLQTLQASKASSQAPGAGDMKDVTHKMATSSISDTTVTKDSSASTYTAKNKPLTEIKHTPPVVRRGESGTPISVTANFIHLRFEENYVFEYGVSYEPDQDFKGMRFKLLNQHSEYFKNKTFDGTTLYVPHKLPDEAMKLVSINPFDNDSEVRITITFRRTRRLSEMIHLYNVLFKSIMKDLGMVRFNRQHFNEQGAIQIPQHKLEVWPGYVTAVDEYEGGLMLTLDSTHRVLRTQSVLSLIKDALQQEGANWKRTLSDTLLGASVMTSYNKKLFRVDSIDYEMTPRSTFEKNEKGEKIQISYVEYYKQHYGIDIMDMNQPMLISRETKTLPGSEKPTDFMICLVPELCQLTGLTDNQRSDFKLMKDVATYTRITPNQRHSAFKQYIKNVMANEKAKSRLAGWGLSIAPETIDITARVLPPEQLHFGNNVRVPGKPTAEWNNEATRNMVLSAVDILKWAVLYTERDSRVARDFLETLKRCCKPMGIAVQPPQEVKLPNDRTESYVTTLKKIIVPSLQLVVAICPTSRDDRYAAIKKICCAEKAIPSQVINARTIMNQNKIRAITQKILLQMNCKLGGTLWGISMPYKSAMVVGIDCYHEAKRQKRSVCAFVASYNTAVTQWWSKATFQEKGQEIIDALKTSFVEALRHYLMYNGNLPDRIIIYRDGVGDGQLKLIQTYEIPQLLSCYGEVDSSQRGYHPVLTYVIVQKRINTRIFLKANGGFENPPPGTVVDHGVTRRDWYDFLIASQKVNQGTVTPTHYVVIYDDGSMTPDQCQRMTYKMCHLYYNWPGTVRVPAPCQYAHKLAYLVGQAVFQPPSVALADKLYFL